MYGVFIFRADAVLTQICERINDLKHIEPGLYMMREMHVKHFLSEFQVSLMQFDVGSIIKVGST